MIETSMLSYSQAACLALDKIPTHSNRQQAKSFFANSPLTVVYLADGNPLEPVIVPESLVVKNPYKYKTYPAILSPLPIPPTATGPNDKVAKQDSASSLHNKPSPNTKNPPANTTSTTTTPSSIVKSNRSTIPINTKSVQSTKPVQSAKSTKSITPSNFTSLKKAEIMQYLKSTYLATEPENSKDYDALFLTNIDLYQELKARYPYIESFHSLHRICLWLHGEMDTFGPLKARRVGNLVKKGRLLWKSKRPTS